MSSTIVRNIAAQAYVNSPVTISLSGLIKDSAVIIDVKGDATAYKQNVTYMPPLDFTGQAVVECDSSDGNKVIITISVVPKPSNSKPEYQKIRTQTRETTMAGLEVEDRFWKIVDDSGPIEGPAAAFVPIRINKVTASGYEEGHDPENVLSSGDSYFASYNGVGSWITLDLGQLCDVSEISIYWKTTSDFSLAVSNDRKSFQKLHEGRGIGISRLRLSKISGVLFKITSMTNTMEIHNIEIIGAPITPKPTATGAQAVIVRASQIVESGQFITMDGSQSRGDIIKYIWDQSTSPTVTIFNDQTSVASFVAPDVEKPVTLQFSLTISDRNGQYSRAESLVYVKPPLVTKVGPETWLDGKKPELDKKLKSKARIDKNECPPVEHVKKV